MSIRTFTALLVFVFFSCSCSQQKEGHERSTITADSVLPPVITNVADLPDSLQPNPRAISTLPRPQVVNVSIQGRVTYPIKSEKGVTSALKLVPPLRKMFPVLQDAKGHPVLDAAGHSIIMGGGGLADIAKFTTDNGLALDALSCSMTDAQGNIWFGTFGGGVSRYDGKSFTNFTVANGLASNQVLSMAQDKAGNIWFGTYGSGVCRYDGRTFTSFTSKHGLANDIIWSIGLDKKGSIWFGSGGGGVSCYDPTMSANPCKASLKNFSTANGLANNTVMCIAEDTHENMWFGTIGGGATRFDGNTFTTFNTGNGLASNVVIYMCPDKHGNLWLGTYGGGASRFDGTKFTTFSLKDGLANDKVVCLAEDMWGNMWFATEGGGVSRFDGRSFTSLSKQQGLASDVVKTITVDRSGNLWFGTFGNGVCLFTSGAFTNYTVPQGLSDYKVYSIAEDTCRRLWLGTSSGGACLYDGQSFTAFTVEQGLISNTVYSVFCDKTGNIWFGTNRGVSRYDGRTFINYAESQGLAHDVVFSIIQDSKSNLWFGTGKGISKYDGQSFTTYTNAQGLAGNDVRCMLEDDKGNIWIATLGGGVSRFDGRSFISFTAKQGLADNNVYSIAEDKTGNLWFATEKGVSIIASADIARLNSDQRNVAGTIGSKGGVSFFKTFSQKDGLPDDFITQVLPLPDGSIALGSNLGITLFRPTEGLTGIKALQVFNSHTGSPVRDINVGQHCLLLDSRGIIWGGSGSEKTGLVRFDRTALHASTLKPFIVLKALKVNEENVFWHGLKHSESAVTKSDTGCKVFPVYMAEEVAVAGRALTDRERDNITKEFRDIQFDGVSSFYPFPQHLKLPYRHNKITIDFNAVETGFPEQVRYRSMLAGYDKGWGPESGKTSVTYGNIPEGSYTFNVKARGPNGLWSEPVMYSFVVLPPWYRAWWAYAAYVVLLLLAVGGFVKWRERSLRVEKERLERTVKKRTEELVQQNSIVERQKKQVEAEKKRSDNLLLNILPKEVAEELRATGATRARQYQNVSVLFTDFVNFTRSAERMDPQALINELHECFKKFDEITDKYNIEKIKTIGDAYLAVAGMPAPDPDHAENVVRAAWEMSCFMRERKERLGSNTFGVRVGVHCGSVTAGVVGVKKFAYDIWGDTVNTAARLQQECDEDKINVSQAVYELVKDKFSFEYRGEHDVKGKGRLNMYYVDTLDPAK